MQYSGTFLTKGQMITMLEKEIERRLGEMLKRRGCIYDKFVSPENPGVPDRIVTLPGGHIIFLELKTEFGRLANIQKWQIDRRRKMGADVRVIKGWDQAQEFVREVERLCSTIPTPISSTAKT